MNFMFALGNAYGVVAVDLLLFRFETLEFSFFYLFNYLE